MFSPLMAIGVAALLIASGAAHAQTAPPPPPPAQAAPAAVQDPVEQLKELGELHQSGVLTDEEFAAQKAKLLG